ncbi:major capsid protein [Kineosporia sp. J2-2]|uniref:Major capsid protein n=1 Tax=Kineosporia corallincola TaxID=2835133 RepID=A0ABS5TL48_9ACTN|nr:major capsid protein [Kineosporia corallincola]MBT0771817.1 major capsid protein [Kineosporia corallincola]
MALWTSAITPAYLTGYVRDSLASRPVNEFALRQWLPTRPLKDLDFRYASGTGGLRRAASARGWDAEPKISKRKQVQRKSGEMAPFSVQKRVGEYERLRLRGDIDADVAEILKRDGLDCAIELESRLEMLRGEALFNAALTIDENEFYQQIDFGRDANHSQTAPTLWSNTGSADPIADLVSYNQQYIDKNGVPPGVILTSTKVRGLLTRNATVRSAFGTTAGTPTIVSPDKLSQILQSFDLPPIVTYDVKYENASGVATRVTPDDSILMLPPPVAPDAWEATQLGATNVGQTLEAEEPEYGLAGNEPGIVVAAHRTDRPISVWTDANVIAMPHLANPDLTFKVKVA